MADDALLADQFIQRLAEGEARLAGAVLHHTDALQSDRVAEPGTHRLGERLFGGKTVGQVEHRLRAAGIPQPLLRSEHAIDEALAVFFQQAGDAVRLDDIDADAVNHRCPPMTRR